MMRVWSRATAAMALAVIAGCGDIQPAPSESAPNHAPSVSLIGPQFVVEGDSIRVEAIVSDQDGDLLSYEWSSSEPTDLIRDRLDRKTTVLIGFPGIRTLRVTVSDGDTLVGDALVTDASPLPLPPTAEFDPTMLVVYAASSVDRISLNQPWVTGLPEPGASSPAPFSIPGIRVSTDRWDFDLVALAEHPRFRPHLLRFDPAVPDSAVWAIIDSTVVLPADAVFGLAGFPDGEYCQWNPGPEPPPACADATYQMAVRVAEPNRTVIWVPGVPDGTEFVLFCYGESTEELPWTPMVAVAQSELIRWHHPGLLDERYAYWNAQRVDTGDLGCALAGAPGVACDDQEVCSFKRYF
jgi:hypothetical protein